MASAIMDAEPVTNAATPLAIAIAPLATKAALTLFDIKFLLESV
jgi:hypothetical protein